MDPVTALVVVAGAEVGKAATQFQTSNAKTAALEMESKQRELQFQQKTLANYDMTNKILDQQLVQGSARGVSLSSPSFEAGQRQTVNIGAKRQQNLETEEDIFERNVRIEKENVQNTLAAELLGDVVETAKGGAEIYKSTPRKA